MEFPFESEAIPIPDAVGRLALQLHVHDGDQMSIDSGGSAHLDGESQSTLWVVQENKVQFSSLSARNYCVAIQSYRESIDRTGQVSELEVFDRALELWRYEIGHADSATGRFLALVSERFNVLEAAARLIDSGEREVFDVLHVVKACLKYLPTITVDGLCAITVAQHPKMSRGHACRMLFNAIEDVLSDRSELAWQLYRHLMSAITDPTLNLATTALMAMAKAGQLDNALNRALADVGSENKLLAQAALGTVARLLDVQNLPDEAKARCFNALRNACRHTSDDVKRAATRSIGLAARRHEALRDDLLELGRSGEMEALAVVVDHLFMSSDQIERYDNLAEFMDVLVQVPPDLGRCVDDIDLITSKLLNDGDNEERILQFLTAWITRNGNSKIRDVESIERFDQTIGGLVERPELLQGLITEWLISDIPQLTSACSGLISFLCVRGVRDIRFSEKILNEMPPDALIHLVRRMLGFVYSEEVLLSLTFSLLDINDAPTRTYPIVRTLLVREVGRNYVGSTLRAIAQRMETASEPLTGLLKSAHDELDCYQKAAKDLPFLLELRGPYQLRRAVALRKAEDMRKTMEAVDERSIFRQIATQVHVKAGIGWFSARQGEIGETTRFEKISHNVSLPMKYIADPIGYEIVGFHYRLSKRGEE